jgi:hypothetical protein
MMGQDLDLMQQAMMAEMGLAAEALMQDYRGQERIWSDAERSAGLLGDIFGGKLGGK